MEKRIYKRSGQSVVEYVVVLALVAIIAISLINGAGQSSQASLQAATDGLEESRVATSTAGVSKSKPSGAGLTGRVPKVKPEPDHD